MRTASGTAESLAEFVADLDQPNATLTAVFASSELDLATLERSVLSKLSGPVVGCTTAGEIGSQGYARGGLVGFSLSGPHLRAHPFAITNLRSLDPDCLQRIITDIRLSVAEAQRETPEARAFGLLLIDGLSVMEEQVAAMLSTGLQGIPIVGGSAGDDLRFERTHVFCNGRILSDAAVFLLVVTTLPFVPIKAQHFSPTDHRLVITRASPEQRLVHEINGMPAAAEYARLVGITQDELTPEAFGNNPLLFRCGGEPFIRSILRANEDGSLTFYCAIEEGLVLRLGRANDLVQNLHQAFQAATAAVPRTALTIGFDCILRRLEIASKGLDPDVNTVLIANRVIGFSTYGEQFGSLHINQTFTGVLLGSLG